MSSDGSTKLFVYGVRDTCPKSVLEVEFGKVGSVTDVYITEKGYAFVTMKDSDSAERACSSLNGATVQGQQVKVEIAHGRGGSDRRRGGGGGGFRGGFRGGNRYGGGSRYEGGGSRGYYDDGGYGGGGRDGGYRNDRRSYGSSGGYSRPGGGGGYGGY